jgi:hypothetical protein
MSRIAKNPRAPTSRLFSGARVGDPESWLPSAGLEASQ